MLPLVIYKWDATTLLIDLYNMLTLQSVNRRIVEISWTGKRSTKWWHQCKCLLITFRLIIVYVYFACDVFFKWNLLRVADDYSWAVGQIATDLLCNNFKICLRILKYQSQRINPEFGWINPGMILCHDIQSLYRSFHSCILVEPKRTLIHIKRQFSFT